MIAIQTNDGALKGTDVSCQCRAGVGRGAKGCFLSLGKKKDKREEGNIYRWEEGKGEKK